MKTQPESTHVQRSAAQCQADGEVRTVDQSMLDRLSPQIIQELQED